MVHVIAGEIFNLSAFDTVCKRVKIREIHTIAFDRNNEEVDYITFEDKRARDVAWNGLVREINKSFYKA